MGIGHAGPIGLEALGDFAIARALRIVVGGKPNGNAASCKVCGAALAKGQGSPVVIAGLRVGQYDTRYLCAGCLARIRACAARFLPGE